MMVWTDVAEAGILERIEAAIADTAKELHAYIKAHADFTETRNRMLQKWEQKCRAFALGGLSKLLQRRRSSANLPDLMIMFGHEKARSFA
jgi:hypothetical protein